MGADLCVVLSDALDGDGLANVRDVARNLGDALGDDTVAAIHRIDLGILADVNGGVAVGSLLDLCDEAADRGASVHFVGPTARVFGD